MAEFQEVMRQWRRMCDKHTCSRDKGALTGLQICPIIATHEGYPCDEDPIDWTEKATKQLEEIVMAWAVEHPEPKYQSWGEWLSEIGVFQCEDGEWRFAKANDPIPADIAQKLGIEPK